MQCILLHGSYSSEDPVKCGVSQGSVLGPICFSLFINDLPLHMKNISVDCDILADDTTLDTSGKYILQISSNMQDKLDQVSNWCNNHNYGHQSDQDQVYDSCYLTSPLALSLVLCGVKTDQVSEHRLLGITIGKKLRWDSHTDNV